MSETSKFADIPVWRFRSALLHWFQHHKRDLPWRTEPRDPYHVWLAETMLQQTQVVTVIPYYLRWLQRFPTLQSLADAPLDDVLKQWEGLGYYSRARNLHRAAQTVVREMAGAIPSSVDQLMELPGIGRYTAGAIASLAFKSDAPILDGNVSRILCRVISLEDDHHAPGSIRLLWNLATRLLPPGRADEFNEAMMNLGAMVCTPKTPSCMLCPVHSLCNAYAKGTPEAYPVRRQKAKSPHKDIATAYICDLDGNVLMAQRLEDGLLGGLWEFPGGEIVFDKHGEMGSRYASAASQLTEMIRVATGLFIPVSPADFSGQVKHAFTHFHMTRHVAMTSVPDHSPAVTNGNIYTNVRWVRQEDIENLALTRSDHKILALARSIHNHPGRLI